MPPASNSIAQKTPASGDGRKRPEGSTWKLLAKSLSAIGIKPGYLERVLLPSWWTDTVAENRNGLLETIFLVHRHTGLTVESLLSGSPEWKDPARTVKFKKARGLEDRDVQVCHNIARQAAEAVATSVSTKWPLSLPSAESIQAAIKEKGESKCVDLQGLVNWCWAAGIPVIHVHNFPSGCKKPDGMAVRTQTGRPVIVLCKNCARPAWQIFILAHELGHIALDHVPEGGAVIDARLESDGEEKEEIEANKFAVTLMTGQPDFGISTSRAMYSSALAILAEEFGVRNRVNPGVVALNWGFATKKWPVANGAVKILEESVDALAIIRNAGNDALLWDSLSTDQAEWLDRMAGLRPQA